VARSQAADQIVHCGLEHLGVLFGEDLFTLLLRASRPVGAVVVRVEIVLRDLFDRLIVYACPLLVG
jgi:hypothetical protein